MNWDDSGFLISKNRYNENSLIVEIFTKNYGKVTGIIFGGTSKKIKNYLQIGNKLFVNYNSKNENRIGHFQIEILNALAPLFFDDNKKLSCVASSMNLIKILTAESQKNIKIYDLLESFFKILRDEYWIQEYIFWELELYKLLGYDLELDNLVKKEIKNDEISYYAITANEKKNVPNFLIDKNLKIKDIKILLKGLTLISNYLDKTILKPNSISYPTSRTHFVNLFK